MYKVVLVFKMIGYRTIKDRDVAKQVLQTTLNRCKPDFERFKDGYAEHIKSTVDPYDRKRTKSIIERITTRENLFLDLRPLLDTTELGEIPKISEKTADGTLILWADTGGGAILLYNRLMSVSASISLSILTPNALGYPSRIPHPDYLRHSPLLVTGLHEVPEIKVLTGKTTIGTAPIGGTNGSFSYASLASEEMMHGWEGEARSFNSPFRGVKDGVWGGNNYYCNLELGMWTSKIIRLSYGGRNSYDCRHIENKDFAERAFTLFMEFKALLNSAIRHFEGHA